MKPSPCMLYANNICSCSQMQIKTILSLLFLLEYLHYQRLTGTYCLVSEWWRHLTLQWHCSCLTLLQTDLRVHLAVLPDQFPFLILHYFLFYLSTGLCLLRSLGFFYCLTFIIYSDCVFALICSYNWVCMPPSEGWITLYYPLCIFLLSK